MSGCAFAHPLIILSNRYYFLDYHSVDTGDVLTGRPYGYTEEYQSYEQTSSINTQKSCEFVYGSGSWTSCELWSESAYPPAFYGQCSGQSGSGAKYCCRNAYPTGNGTYPPTTYYFLVKYNEPVYGYVTRTRTVTYDKQSGLFSIGIGVPYASYNAGLYSTQVMRIIDMLDTSTDCATYACPCFVTIPHYLLGKQTCGPL